MLVCRGPELANALYIIWGLTQCRPSSHTKHSSQSEMESQRTNTSVGDQSGNASQWHSYATDTGGDGFVQSLLSSPGTDVLDYPDGTYNRNPANAAASYELELERQRKEKNNLASRKSRAVKKERFAAMTEEIEQLQAENHHLRNVVQEMDSVIHEAQNMVMHAKQRLP